MLQGARGRTSRGAHRARPVRRGLGGKIEALRDKIAVLELVGGTEGRSPGHREFLDRRTEFDTHVARFNDRLHRVQESGCLPKDIHQGLVDFYCVHDGRLIFLCWMLGEKEIGYWHELHAGFAGRRPVSELKLSS